MGSDRMGDNCTYSAATVTTSAALLVSGKSQRESVLVKNNHASNILYLGSDSSVTTANGMSIAAGATLKFDDYNGPLYAIASAASTDVRLIEIY